MAILGKDCKLYYSTSPLTGTTGGEPADLTWVEIDNVKDLTLNMSKGEADVSTRGSSWKKTRATLKEASVDFSILWLTTDAAFTALQNAWLNDTAIAIAVMDGDIDTTASEGLCANMDVFAFTRNEQLVDGVTADVNIKPREYAEWYTVAAS